MLNKNIYNIALLGCGRIAERHANLLSNKEIQYANLVAVCDINKKRADTFGKKFSVNQYYDLHNMMVSENIDVVAVLTDSGLHFQNVMDLIDYGVDLIVEKPLALRIDHVDLMIKACEEKKIKLFVVKQNRFNLPVVELSKAIKQKRFGKLTLGTVRVRWCRDQNYYDQDDWRGSWLFDGGVIANQASHHIDLLQWCMGDVESVYAVSRNSIAKIETEDTAIALLTFKNGALGVVEATTAARPIDLEGSLSILGSEGTVDIGGFAVNEIKHWNFCNPRKEDEHIIKNSSTNPPNVYGFGHKEYYNYILDCLKRDVPGNLSGREGKKSVELINAIYASAETGKTIFLDSFNQKSKLGFK